jgi:hypothetical protein
MQVPERWWKIFGVTDEEIRNCVNDLLTVLQKVNSVQDRAA